ncbi:LysR substrate-binding domain-containing protein, partial [Pseudomonas chlororaphis]|uniref:LysR substrate-binding domain-containing protein n=1 Tax=Pseudomonas chlororaphis TaxID=587753 RepID=UPI001FF099E7
AGPGAPAPVRAPPAGYRAAAPGTRLAVLELEPGRLVRQAEQGIIDLALHTSEDSPPGLRRRVLFSERYVLVGRAGHPRLQRRPSLAQFGKLEHVMVSPDGGGFHGVTDSALGELGLTRRVVLSVPHFLFVLSALATTDLVAMLPSRLVRDNPALKVVEPPLEVPGYEMAMLWHERCHRDPAHQWLREFIVSSL